MNHDDLDDLDRALFALPLAEPPVDLRASILRATVYAPVAAPAFGRVETVVVGLLLAIATWLAILCATDASLVRGLGAVFTSFLSALSDPRTIVWLGFGAATAALLTFGNLGNSLGIRVRNGRS